jgi:hypothetical protein
MELATLRTRRSKQDAKLSELTSHWQAEAKALGFDLGRSLDHMQANTSSRSHTGLPGRRGQARSPVAQSSPPAALAAGQLTQHHSAAQLGSRLGQVLRTLDQPAGMSGVRIKLRYREHERD